MIIQVEKKIEVDANRVNLINILKYVNDIVWQVEISNEMVE